jgi:ubiquitin-activating enzyme E1
MSKIDESLYSRQLYAIGKDTMNSIINGKVLIINMDPLAVEICKNIILSGVGNITLADKEKISEKDYNNYYINSKDIGKNRVDVIGFRLKELNSNVNITKYTGEITSKLLSKFNLIVFVDCEYEFILKHNEYCHLKNIKTIACSSKGFMGYVFCDFIDFKTNDINGEKLKEGIILYEKDSFYITNKPHDFEINMKIKLNNSDEIYTITMIKDKNTFKTDKILSHLGEYIEVKDIIEIKFKNFKDSVENPEFVNIDYKGNELKLHKININLMKLNEDNYDNYNNLSNFEQQIISGLSGQLVPVNSIIGGIVSNQIISGISNKYTPIKQWLYYECVDIIDFNKIIFNSNYKYNKIYSNQVNVIGTELQEKINNYNIFIVGSGAIGCEHLKNFSMMGIGNITITDMDTIEKSNLSRQFLFRNSDIGKSKAEVAVNRVNKMNPHIKINYKLNKMGIETEHIFNNTFYEKIDCIINALDNVNARIYMDNQAIIYKKPLLESGTLGLKGNTQVILPNLTESYQSSQDKPEESIPICTIKNFPYEISHCVQWAREQFEKLFVLPFKTYTELKNLSFDKLESNLKSLRLNELIEIEIQLNYINKSNYINYKDFYNENFRQNIYDLITKFPKDYITEEGEQFWSQTKKFPQIIDFSEQNEVCMDNYKSYLQIINNIYKNSNLIFNDLIFNDINSKLIKKIENTNDDINTDIKEIEIIKNIIEQLSKMDFKFNLIEFEKDDFTNGHIDFITSTSNLRALNYSIKTADKFETKGIAGKIIPALATTTSIISGLVSIELYKIIFSQNIEKFKNSFISLGISYFGSSEPLQCKNTKIGNLDISLWTQLKFQNMTFQELIYYFEIEYNLNIEQIIFNDKTIYNIFFNEKKKNDILSKDILKYLNLTEAILTITISDIDNDELNEIINVFIKLN